MMHVHNYSMARDYFCLRLHTQFIRAYDYSKLKDERPKFDEEK